MPLGVGACSEGARSHRSTQELRERLVVLLESAEDATPETFDEIGATYWELGELDAAEHWLKKGLQVAPRDAALNINLAQVVAQRGRYLEAVPYCRGFLEVEPRESQHRRWANDLVSVADRVAGTPSADDAWEVSGDTAQNSLGMTFVRIPEGRFTMGDDAGPGDVKPEHVVELSPYWISSFEVTLKQYQEFLNSTDYNSDGSPPFARRPGATPAVAVSWRDARAFSIWLSAREQAVYRLPTEAEWEYAARGADGRKNPWGNDAGAPGTHGNWGRLKQALQEQDLPATEEVGSYPAGASPFGLLDMAGNAREWCLDLYVSDYYAAAPRRDPTGPISVRRFPAHSLRGSSWRDSLETGHATMRYKADSNQGYDSFGLRLVREVEAEALGAPTHSE